MKHYVRTEAEFDVVPKITSTPLSGGMTNTKVKTQVKLTLDVSRVGLFVTDVSNAEQTSVQVVSPDRKLARPGMVLVPLLENANEDVLGGPVAVGLCHPWSDAAGLMLQTEGEEDGCSGDLAHYQKFLVQRAAKELHISAMSGDGLRFSSTVQGMNEPWLAGEDYFAKLGVIAPTPDKAVGLRVQALVPRGAMVPDADDPPMDGMRAKLPLRADECELFQMGARKHDELWIQLWHYDQLSEESTPAGNIVARDLALFTVAPTIFPSHLQAPEVFVIARIPEEGGYAYYGTDGPTDEIVSIAREACPLVVVVDLPELETDRDRWMRDAAFTGHVHGADDTTPIVVRTTKDTPLSVRTAALCREDADQLSPDCAFYGGLHALRETNNSMDFGGNLIVTPPIPRATALQAQGGAGPAVPKHPIARYGKLVVGDGTDRPSAATRHFLYRQSVQPVVPIDTSWLEVKHADEVVSVVPAAKTCGASGAGAKGWALLMADMGLAAGILKAVHDQGWAKRHPRDGNDFLALGLPSFASSTGELVQGLTLAPHDSLPKLNAGTPAHQALTAVRERLVHCLALDAADVISMPVLYRSIADTFSGYESVLSNVVNLVVLGTTVIIPKPWGPRVNAEDMQSLLYMISVYLGLERNLFSNFGDEDNLARLRREVVWVRTIEQEQELEDSDELSDELPPPPEPLRTTVAKRLGVAANKVVEGKTIGPWNRFVATLPTIDIFEAYIRARLEPLGLSVHFVDVWKSHHSNGGEIHCGSNERRAAVTVKAEHAWWTTYEAYLAAEIA